MKKLWKIVLCTALVLLLAACGKNAKTTWQEQYDLGMQYLEDGDYEQAIVAFTAAIKIDPKQTVVYVGRAQAYIGSGETEENLSAALTDYESALVLDDMNPDIYLGIADVYIRQGDYEKAKEILNQALENLGENEAISEKINELENGDITDADGKTRRRAKFDENGNLVWYHELFYNAEGKTSKVIAYTADGTETGEVDWLYDENGYAIQQSSWYSAGEEDIDGTLIMVKREVDNEGKIMNEASYSLDGSLLQNMTYEYDAQGEVIKETRDDGTDITVTEFENDENGYLVKSSDYYNNELTMYTIYENDANGNCIREDWYDVWDGSNGVYAGSVTYELDENGDIITETKYDADGNIEYSTEVADFD